MDDFEVDAEGGGVLDEVLAVAAVNPDLADRGMGHGHLVEEGLACGGVLDTGCGDQDRQQLRLRPTIFLPASTPWPTAGTLVEVLTLCASMTQAVGFALRPSRCRTCSRSRPLSWAKIPFFCHLAK